MERTFDDVKDMQKATKKAPNRDDLRRMFPGKEKVRTLPNGKTEWCFDIEKHDRSGNLTADGKKFVGAFGDYMKAEAARGAALASRDTERVAMRDASGSTRLLHPSIAEDAARRNGWHSGRVAGRGKLYMAQRGPVLWRRGDAGWEPVDGYRQGLFYSPDGRPWRGVGGKWVALEPG